MEELKVIEYKDIRVLTTQQLAECYETQVKNIQMNYKNNKARFVEGRDYYELKGDTLKEFKNSPNVIGLVDKRTPSLILWTERGANRHSKILDTDKAWQQFDVLEETYFRVRHNITEPNQGIPKTYKEALLEIVHQIEENEKLQLENNVQRQQINEMQPKSNYYDLILKTPGLMTITSIAKDYGKSGKAMNNELYRLGIQYRQGDLWLLYSKYQDKGYTKSETITYTRKDGSVDSRLHTKWTQKGRLFLYEILKENGIYPVMERDKS